MLAHRLSFSVILLLLIGLFPKNLRAQDQCPGGAVYVTPDGGTDTVPHNSNSTVYFTVQAAASNGDCNITVALTPSGTGSVSNVSLENSSQSPLTLYSGDQAIVGVTFDIGGPASQGTLNLAATGWWGAGSDNGYRSVIAQSNGPFISLQDYNQDYLDVTKCVASCFDGVASYATEPHYGQNITHAPASMQLLYRSSLAHPMAVVQFNAWDTTGTYPAKMSVRLQDEQGAWVQFTNGATETFFACPTNPNSCDSTWNRLAVQFDASGKATGAYLYTLTVRSWHLDGSSIETLAGIRVLIDNEATSPFGAGWTLAGLERVYPGAYPLDGVAITEGNGSIVYFALEVPGCTGNCSYLDGDFTVLTGHYGAGSTYIKWDRRYPGGTTFNFYPDGRLAYVTDRFGNKATVYTYNGSNQLVGIGDTIASYNDGVLHRLDWYWLTYDPNAKLGSIWSQVAHGVSVTIDGATGNLTSLQGPIPGYTPGVYAFQGTYDNQHRLTHWTDRRGGAWDIYYDFAGKVDSAKGPAIRADSASSGSNPSIRPKTRYASLESTMLPDPASGLGYPGSTPAPAQKADTLRARITNPRGFVTAYALNRFGQATRIEEPLGRTTRFTLDGEGRHLVDTLPSGDVIQYTWSGPNLTQQRDGFTTRTINYTYDGTFNLKTGISGDVDSVSWAVNSVSHDGFPSHTIVDSTWRGKWKADSTEVLRGTEWDPGYPSARCVTTWPYRFYQCRYRGNHPYDPTNTNQELVNDSAMVTTYVEDFTHSRPPFARVSWVYDWTGRPIRTITRVSSSESDTTWTVYDTRGRDSLVTVQLHDTVRATTKYFYDPLYLTKVQDAKGQVYSVWPNALGWPDSTSDPAGAKTFFYYDLNGNIDSVTNRRAQKIKHWRDALDHDTLVVEGMDTTRFTTDPHDTLRTAKNRESTDTVRFDPAGRKVAEITCRVLIQGQAAQCFKGSSTYNTRDLRTSLAMSSAFWYTHTATFYYNASRARLDSMTNFTNETMAFGYTRPTERDSTRTFRALNLTQTFAHGAWLDGTTAISFSDDSLTHAIGSAYRYDEAGRITRPFHGRTATPDTTRSVVFDRAGRDTSYADTSATGWTQGCTVDWAALANAQKPDTRLGETCDYTKRSGWTLADSARYVYDAVGNRMDSTAQAYAAVASGNRLVRWKNFRMTYDADGNLLVKRALKTDTTQVFYTDSMFWSPLGKLDSLHYADATGHSIRTNFGYDGWGRYVRNWFPDFASSTERYVYDDDERLFVLDTLGNRRAYYTWYPGTHEPQSVAFINASNIDSAAYFITDAMHNVVARLRRSSGGGYLLDVQYHYGPFGDSLPTPGPQGKRGEVRYKEAFYTPAIHMYLMGARYYDPDVGRFISEDPIGLDGGINLYAFGGNNPINGWDPSGEFSIGTVLQVIQALADCPKMGLLCATRIAAVVVEGRTPCLATRCDAMESQTWNDPLLVAVAFVAEDLLLGARGAAGLVTKQSAALRRATGGVDAWVRFGKTYSETHDMWTVGARWGSNAHYAQEIGNTTMRAINQWIRDVRIPHAGWWFADPGHLHFLPWMW